jgi:uncharacterized protein with von Willebrand factor type A (vWA) domain
VDAKPSGASIDRLKFLARTFRHAVWFNPMPPRDWEHTWTTEVIRQVFPMFELTLDGLEKAVNIMMRKN